MTGWIYCSPPRYSRTLSFALTYGHDSRVLMQPAIDIVWQLSLSPSLTVVMTPCYCGSLGGLHVLVGSLPYPSPGLMFEPSCFGRLQCLEAGLTSRPLLTLLGLCLMPDL